MKLLLFLFASAISLCADDITTTDGKIYKGATIIKHDAATATILYADGGATVDIATLSPELQKKLDYDPAKATELQEQIKTAALDAEAAKLKAKISQLLQEAACPVEGKIIQVLSNGFLGELNALSSRDIIVSKNRVDSRGFGLLPSGISTTKEKKTIVDSDSIGLVFVNCDTTGLIDDQAWSGVVWKCGTYSYDTVNGSQSTVAKYTISEKEAWNAYKNSPDSVPIADAPRN